VTDRCLNDMRCFRGGLTLGVHKIPFRVFSSTATAIPDSVATMPTAGCKIFRWKDNGYQ
jgi:hypothetical protein